MNVSRGLAPAGGADLAMGEINRREPWAVCMYALGSYGANSHLSWVVGTSRSIN